MDRPDDGSVSLERRPIGLPEVEALIDAGDANRRRGVETLVSKWHRGRALRSGLGPRRAADTMWLLTGVHQYLEATDALGWSGATYEKWLGELLERVLFDPEAVNGP